MMKISATIVIYNENSETLKRAIESFLSIPLEKELVVIDNSPASNLKDFVESYPNTVYIFNNRNVGFGKAHNIGFKALKYKSDYHIVLNPDVYFVADEIQNLVLWCNKNQEVSLTVPKVFFPNGVLQNTIRNIPTPITLIKRRLNFFGLFDSFVKKDEYNGIEFKGVTEIPFAHGCFFVFKTDVFEELKGFDERFFMYMEDVDIFLRAKRFGKTVINPNYKIYHEYRKGSSKKMKLLVWHIISAVKFFWKYR